MIPEKKMKSPQVLGSTEKELGAAEKVDVSDVVWLPPLSKPQGWPWRGVKS